MFNVPRNGLQKSVGLNRRANTFRPRSRLVTVNEPYMSVVEIAQQFQVLAVAHVTSPHNFRGVDVGCIRDPLMVWDVLHPIGWLIANQDQMIPRLMVKLLDDRDAIQISSRPGRF